MLTFFHKLSTAEHSYLFRSIARFDLLSRHIGTVDVKSLGYPSVLKSSQQVCGDENSAEHAGYQKPCA